MGAPYKGGEQEELSRASLQRRGVRRDVRQESRLREGRGGIDRRSGEAPSHGNFTFDKVA